jgi:hypothetical protein
LEGREEEREMEDRRQATLRAIPRSSSLFSLR